MNKSFLALPVGRVGWGYNKKLFINSISKLLVYDFFKTSFGVSFLNKLAKSKPKYRREDNNNAAAVASSKLPTIGRLSGRISIIPAEGLIK
jgi:hypothetical protein